VQGIYACRVRSPSQPGAPGAPVASSDTQLARTVHLLHRRRGWGWTAAGGFLAFLLASAVYSNRYSATGSGPVAILVIMMVLAALTIIGTVVAIADSVLLSRRSAVLRWQAISLEDQHSRRAHAYRYPPRHGFSFLGAWVMLACVLGLGVLFLPGVVNGISYLSGGNSVMFVPQSWQTTCSYYPSSGNVCSTSTDGILETGGAGMSATWPDQVPLNHPFLVREPLWRWGLGAALISNDRIAIVAICVSLLFIGFSVVVVIFFVKMVRNWLLYRRQKADREPATASAGSGGQPRAGQASQEPPSLTEDEARVKLRRRPRGLLATALVAGLIVGGKVAIAGLIALIWPSTPQAAQSQAPVPAPTVSVSVNVNVNLPSTSTTTASFGSAIKLAGISSGEQVTITPVRVINSATASDPIFGPAAGERYYTVQFRFDNTGRVPYSPTPALEATVIDTAGKSYIGDTFITVSGCPLLSDSASIAPGASVTGCVPFDVPSAATIRDITYTLDTGLGPQTGRWTVAG
jgi:hypothetical protein